MSEMVLFSASEDDTPFGCPYLPGLPGAWFGRGGQAGMSAGDVGRVWLVGGHGAVRRWGEGNRLGGLVGPSQPSRNQAHTNSRECPQKR